MYFDIADTILDTEVQTRLGMQSLFSEDWALNGPDRIKLAGEWRLGVHLFLASAARGIKAEAARKYSLS